MAVNGSPSMYGATCEWRYRDQHDRPKAHEFRVMPGWVLEKWFWNGEAWMTGIWRTEFHGGKYE